MTRWLEISANRRTIAYILFSAVMLGAMIAAGIVPARHQMAQTRQKARQLEARIEEQKIFHPLYQSLKEKTENTEESMKKRAGGSVDQPRSFTIDDTGRILVSMAESAGIENSSFSPAPSSMDKNDNRLLVNGRLQGDFTDFRDFLISLVTSSAFDELELLEARSGTLHPEYRLRLWLAIE